MKKKLKYYIIKLGEIYKFLRFIRFSKIKKNQNILIYGISRGGTTMLAEALVKIFNARLAWEPLFPHKDVPFKEVNPFSVHQYTQFDLGWNPHLTHQNHAEINHYFDSLFGLNVRNIRLWRFNEFTRFNKKTTTIFKFCFGNFMYTYFQERYKFKSLVLLRHPFAIAASSLTFGDNYSWHKNNYDKWKYQNNQYSNMFFNQYGDKYHLINSAFTLLVFQAVSQFVYLKDNLDKANSIFVFYEDLVIKPEEVIHEIEKFFDMSFNKEELLLQFKKQSFSSGKDHTKDKPMGQLSKWKEKISEEEINGGLKIFKAFNFEIYDNTVLPNKSKF